MNTEMFCGIQDERAPSTTDIEQTLPGPEPQLATDIIELLLLCIIEIIARRVEISTRINHATVEPEMIKLIRQIVMKRHGFAIALDRVFSAPPIQQHPSRCPYRWCLASTKEESCHFQLLFPVAKLAKQDVRDFERDCNVAFDIEIVAQIC